MRRLFSTTRHDGGVTVAPLSPAPPTSSTDRRRSLLIRAVTSVVIVGVTVAFLAGVATHHLPRLSPTGPSMTPVRGGSVVDDDVEPTSLLPWVNYDNSMFAIWAPLWYGDSHGIFQPGLAKEVPSPANGGISADLST